MRPVLDGHLPEVLEARARRDGRRRAASDHPRSDPDARGSGRRSSKSRRWPTFPPAPASARPAASPRRCSRRSTRIAGGCCIRDELAELACEIEIERLRRADRQAGSVHRRVRRRDLFHLQSRRQRRGATASAADGCAVRPRGQPAAVLHRVLAQRRQHPRGSEAANRARTTTRCCDNLHYVKELGLRSRQALESGRHALFGELMHEHWEHKSAARGMSNPQIDEWYELGREERRDRRQAGRRRRRRVPACSTPRITGACARRWPRRASKKCGSASTSKARRCCSSEPAGG